PVTKQLTHWYGKRERGTWWSVCSSSHNAGGYLIAILAALLAGKFGWRYAMYIPGVICIAGGILLLNRLRDSPQSLGLPPIEKFKKEENLTSSLHSEDSAKHDSLSVKQILFEHVLINKFVWALAISYFFIYVVRTAFNDWGMWYLVEEKNYSQYVAGLTVSWFEVGGFLGTIFAGWGSDCFFKGKRVPYMVFCAIALIFLVPAFWYSTQVNVFLDSCLMAGIGFFVFGPQMLAGLAAAELVHKKAAGTSNGFAGLFGYLGAAVSGYPLGFVIEKYHWRGFFIALFICSAATLIILLPMWSVGATDQTPEKRKEEDEAANLLWGNAD
ncbi:MAG: transporter family glucose-6-phosphate receptor UhpC, partial [Francisellaceae bacterium]|nr:transporter family glucose-6-phosphate receptor UhpC [Francisellaceae bacterium]